MPNWDTGLCCCFGSFSDAMAICMPCVTFGQEYALAVRDGSSCWPRCCLCMCCYSGMCNMEAVAIKKLGIDDKKAYFYQCCVCLELVACCGLLARNRYVVGTATGVYSPEENLSYYQLLQLACPILLNCWQYSTAQEKRQLERHPNLDWNIRPAPYIGPYTGLLDLEPPHSLHMLS